MTQQQQQQQQQQSINPQELYYALRQRASDLSTECDQVSEQISALQNSVTNSIKQARLCVLQTEHRTRSQLVETEKEIFQRMMMMMMVALA